MVKKELYEGLLNTKILNIKQLPRTNEIPYTFPINKVLSYPDLFDHLTLLSETAIKAKDIKFNKLCAASVDAIPYAVNIATSFEKGVFYIDSSGHNGEENDNIKNIKIEGEMEIDDNIIVVETVCKKNYLLENILTKIRKFGGNVVGVLIILDICEGEFVNLIDNKEPLIKVLNIYDIFSYYENNNLVDMFCTERLKFFCEKETKLAIRKLAESKAGVVVAAEVSPEVSPDVTPDNNSDQKQIFVSQ